MPQPVRVQSLGLTVTEFLLFLWKKKADIWFSPEQSSLALIRHLQINT